MKRRWKVLGGLVGVLLLARYAEPFVVDWLADEDCAFGPVSSEEFRQMRVEGAELLRESGWRMDGRSQGASEQLGRILIEARKGQPTIEGQIMASHALMVELGGRLYNSATNSMNRSLEGGRDFLIQYRIYRLRGPEFCPIFCLVNPLRYRGFALKVSRSSGDIDISSIGDLGILGSDFSNFDTDTQPVPCIDFEILSKWKSL